MLYKGVSNAARLPEGDLAKAGGFSASSLPYMDNASSNTNARPEEKNKRNFQHGLDQTLEVKMRGISNKAMTKHLGEESEEQPTNK